MTFACVVQALYTPCANPCTPVHTPGVQYVHIVFPLLYPIYSTFLNLRSVHSPSTLRASYHACPMQAPCTPFAHFKHARSMQGVSSVFCSMPHACYHFEISWMDSVFSPPIHARAWLWHTCACFKHAISIQCFCSQSFIYITFLEYEHSVQLKGAL